METEQVAGLRVDRARPRNLVAQRPTLLLVHGAGHGSWCWENWLGVLPGRGWEVLAPSLRNHPGSHAVPERAFLRETRLQDYVEEVASVAAHGGRPVVVVGHSMGGIVCQMFAAQAQQGRWPGVACAGLVLLASVAPAPFGPIREAALPLDHGYTLDAATAQARYFFGASPEVVKGVLARLVPESPAAMNEYSLGRGVVVNPTAVRCPVLVMTAEREGTSAPRDRRIADFLGGDYVLCRDIGHDLMLDAGWQEVLEDLLRWLERRWPA